MSRPAEKAARDYWYCIGTASTLAERPGGSRLLGEDILVSAGSGTIAVEAAGRPLPVRERYGMVWMWSTGIKSRATTRSFELSSAGCITTS